MTDKRYYVRRRDRVLGPFSVGQLRSFQDRNQLTLQDEVSEDRENWVPAAEIPGLLPAPRPSASTQPTAPPQAANRSGEPAAPDAEWFYLDGANQQQGPLAWSHVLRLHRARTIQDDTLVWKRGMPEWQPFAAVGGKASALEEPDSYQRRTAAKPGSQALVAFLKDPVGQLPVLCEVLGPRHAFSVGAIFCAVACLCAVLGFVLVMGDVFNAPVVIPGVGHRPVVRMPAAQRVVLVAKFVGVTLLTLGSLTAAITLIRVVTRGSGTFGYDVLSAGAAVLPMGLVAPLAALLLKSDDQIVLLVFLFVYLSAMCLSVLILNSAFTRILKLSDQGVTLAIPATVMLALLLCKLAVALVPLR